MHIIKSFLQIAILIGASVTQQTHGAIVSLNNALSGGDTGTFHRPTGAENVVVLKNSTGSLLPAGTVFRIGFFLNYTNDLNPTLASGSFDSLTSASSPNRFVAIGVGDAGRGTDTRAAEQLIKDDGAGNLRVNTSISDVTYSSGTANTLVDGGLARGTKLFVFLLNQNSFSGTPTQWGIYGADTWVIPASGTANLTLSLKAVDTLGEVYRGSLGSLLTAVPEPSAMTFGIAALGLITIRRRR